MLARLLHPEVRETLTEPTVPAVLPCASPVRRAPVVFPKSVTRGGSVDFEMASGYINVTSDDLLFYWYVGAAPDAPADAPLLVWSNGGPGCSAMEGATTEGGALWLWDAKQSGKTGFTGHLTRNPYAWNAQAHLVFVDQPRYVGYSTGTGKKITSSVEAGLDMVAFLRGWYSTFPEHKHRRLILASESYGGHYVPAWVSAVLDFNEAAPQGERLPLAGMMIGNGIVNETAQQPHFAEFAAAQNLIPAGSKPVGEGATRALIEKTLGYSPNFYDYRLEQQTGCCGCGGYDYGEWAGWFMRDDVKEALNVCGSAGTEAFGGCGGGCVGLPSFDDGDRFDYSGAIARALDAGVNLTFYYGEQDTACNYVGALAMANSSLHWGGTAAWARAPARPLHLAGASVGSVRSAVGPSGATLTFITADGAGHMVPMDNGAAASLALASIVG